FQVWNRKFNAKRAPATGSRTRAASKKIRVIVSAHETHAAPERKSPAVGPVCTKVRAFRLFSGPSLSRPGATQLFRRERGAEAGAPPESGQLDRREPKDRHRPSQWLIRRRDRGKQ